MHACMSISDYPSHVGIDHEWFHHGLGIITEIAHGWFPYEESLIFPSQSQHILY
jgi:hypothetical protein